MIHFDGALVDYDAKNSVKTNPQLLSFIFIQNYLIRKAPFKIRKGLPKLAICILPRPMISSYLLRKACQVWIFSLFACK